MVKKTKTDSTQKVDNKALILLKEEQVLRIKQTGDTVSVKELITEAVKKTFG